MDAVTFILSHAIRATFYYKEFVHNLPTSPSPNTKNKNYLYQ